MDWLERTKMLFGEEKIDKLSSQKVWIFGLGGVGSYAAMAVARGGVGHIALVDHDTVDMTNINRQLPASSKTIGQYKTEVMRQMILDINPQCQVDIYTEFYGGDNKDKFSFQKEDAIIDAIDCVTSKLLLIEEAKKAGSFIICSMGTGNKFDPTQFQVSYIEKTTMCPLAKVMRYELKKRRISRVKCVYSTEKPQTPKRDQEGNIVPASCSFVPPVCGFILAGEVIKHLTDFME